MSYFVVVARVSSSWCRYPNRICSKLGGHGKEKQAIRTGNMFVVVPNIFIMCCNFLSFLLLLRVLGHIFYVTNDDASSRLRAELGHGGRGGSVNGRINHHDAIGADKPEITPR